MPKLTDEEVGQLLRETFADKENLVDQLPSATTARRKLPMLLAAASVLAVLGGGVAIVGTDHKQEARPAGETTKSVVSGVRPQTATTTTAELNLTTASWGVALKEAMKWERPAAGWPAVKILDRPYRTAGNPSGQGGAGQPFDAKTRTQLEGYAGVPVEWVASRPGGDDVCDKASGQPYITIGQPVFDKSASNATLGMSVWRGCMDALWVTYRLADVPNPSGGVDWKVTGTVGPVAMS